MMATVSRHPLVEEYLAELRRRAGRLPRRERDELLGELGCHVDAGAAQAPSDADIRNMLDALGTPEEIVAASATAVIDPGPSGRLALGFAILALVLVPVPLAGIAAIPFGIVAVVLGIRAHRVRRSVAQAAPAAVAAAIIGGVAVALVVLAYLFLIAV